MSGNKKSTRDRLKDIRSKSEFIDVVEKLWQKGSVVKTVPVHENTWNRYYTLLHQGKLSKVAKLVSCGEVSMEIHHALGILILVNESYR